MQTAAPAPWLRGGAEGARATVKGELLPWRPFRGESGTRRGPGVWEEDGLPGTLGTQQGPAAAPTELRTRPTAPCSPASPGMPHPVFGLSHPSHVKTVVLSLRDLGLWDFASQRRVTFQCYLLRLIITYRLKGALTGELAELPCGSPAPGASLDPDPPWSSSSFLFKFSFLNVAGS